MRPKNGHPILGQQLPYDGFGFVFPVIMASATTLFLLALLAASPAWALDTNRVANGSFEQSQTKPGVPDDWSAAGNRAVKQALSLDTGRDGQRCAKLACTEFTGDGPDHHAMICQLGSVSVRRGQWYRLTLWAKAEGIRTGAIEVALTDTRRWENAGLAEAFLPGSQWQQFDFLFRADQDLPAAASRLQFWFKGTGTLWLDDVVLAEAADGRQWFPQISTDGVKNFVPNSSFECGTANWGSFTYGLSGWAGNLYRLEGAVDGDVAQHSRHSLKIALAPATLPVFHFDYYEPVRQPVRRVLAANRGWFRVKPGEKLTLSAYLQADVENVAAQLVVNEAPNHLLRKQVTVTKEWERHEFAFTPSQPFIFIAIGLDLEASRRDAATLWLDSVQLEHGDRATAYEPRQPVESFLDAGTAGNVFTNTTPGPGFTLKAFNNTDRARTVRGTLQVTDFYDRVVEAEERELRCASHTRTALSPRACSKEPGRGISARRGRLALPPPPRPNRPSRSLLCAAQSSFRQPRIWLTPPSASIMPILGTSWCSLPARPASSGGATGPPNGRRSSRRRASSISAPPMRKSSVCSIWIAKSKCCSPSLPLRGPPLRGPTRWRKRRGTTITCVLACP